MGVIPGIVGLFNEERMQLHFPKKLKNGDCFGGLYLRVTMSKNVVVHLGQC